MKTKTLELLRNFQHRLSRSRRWLFVAVITLCLIPSNTRAQGIGDILLLLHTITSTLQGPIGGALSEMRTVSAAVNNFRQQIIWPLALINQTRAFVSATRARYTGLMSQIEGIKNNSATLALPMQLESVFRSAQSGSIGQIPSMYAQVYQPVALAEIAQPVQRNMMDIDDAMSMDSLKTAVVSDQTTQGMLTLADSLEQQSDDRGSWVGAAWSPPRPGSPILRPRRNWRKCSPLNCARKRQNWRTRMLCSSRAPWRHTICRTRSSKF